MSAVKSGKQREEGFVKQNYVGLTEVTLTAVCPTREDVNKIYGKEDSDDDKPKQYLSTDKEGNDQVRLEFWLHSKALDRYFTQSIFITRKPRLTTDGKKIQYINSTCTSTYIPFIDGTDEPDESLIVDWFKVFKNKKTGEELGKKKYWKATSGEGELCELVRNWLGGIKWSDRDTDVSFDMDKILKEDYSELRELINGDWDKPFTILLGVETDSDDKTKKYQKIWGKYLPAGIIEFVEKGKFPNDYVKDLWSKFEADVKGDYGFDVFHKLVPAEPYNEDEDPLNGETAKVVDEASADY